MIYIVRHGQTDWNVEGRYQGRKDIELNSTGIEQAKITKEKLFGIDFDSVISSPLKRALKTAEIISGVDNADGIIIDQRIIQRSNAELEGKIIEESNRSTSFNDINNAKSKIESIADFRERIFDFCKNLENNYVTKNVLVVTHSGVIVYIRCYFEGEPKNNNYKTYKLGNCEIIKYNNSRKGSIMREN